MEEPRTWKEIFEKIFIISDTIHQFTHYQNQAGFSRPVTEHKPFRENQHKRKTSSADLDSPHKKKGGGGGGRCLVMAKKMGKKVPGDTRKHLWRSF